MILPTILKARISIATGKNRETAVVIVYSLSEMVSVFAARSVGVRDIVLTGNVTKFDYCKTKFEQINSLGYGVNFTIPGYSRYGTVIGTALGGLPKEDEPK